MIHSVKERYGFSYWKVTVADGRDLNFTMQDTFRNIIRVGEDKAILLDVDGNRFVIESIMELDGKSHKKIENFKGVIQKTGNMTPILWVHSR